ncbi:MAG: hypothetical protein KGL39_26995 [Patescibacteria group bacterium]|nr:hypothetical protein [Patescibacteria group bacterium]
MSEKPTRAAFSEQNVLDYENGPAQEYSDGYAIYMLRGVRFDKEEYEKIVNKTITAKEVMQIEDVDKRTIAISMLSPEEMIKQLKMKLIDTGSEGTRLYECKNFMGTRKTEYAIRMTDWSTPREFIEFIPPEVGKVGSAVHAQASAYGIADEDYLLIKDRG